MENQNPEQHERLWRELSAVERDALRGQPELELEARLTQAIKRLPEVPVSSNFTARVLAAIDLEESRAARSPRRGWNWHALLPRFALATACVLFVGLGVQHYEVVQHRAVLARSVSLVASAQSMPSVDALENLDAIQRMSQASHADTELLTDLQ